MYVVIIMNLHLCLLTTIQDSFSVMASKLCLSSFFSLFCIVVVVICDVLCVELRLTLRQVVWLFRHMNLYSVLCRIFLFLLFLFRPSVVLKWNFCRLMMRRRTAAGKRVNEFLLCSAAVCGQNRSTLLLGLWLSGESDEDLKY